MLKDNLIMLRKLNGYSQEQIAEKINISRQAYAKWESGVTVPDIEKAARMMGIERHVEFSLGAGDYPKGKPDPSSYLMAAERFGVDPASCVVTEDSEVGVAAGVAAGMRVIALDRKDGRDNDFSGAWRIVRSLDEIDVEREFE